MIFCIENNQYGMGTSISRSSCNNDYYTMGNVIPGLKMDGMNVLSVREGIKFKCREGLWVIIYAASIPWAAGKA